MAIGGTALLSGVFGAAGGLIANFGANMAWRYYTRPVIEARRVPLLDYNWPDDVDKNYIEQDRTDAEHVNYNMEVSNSGRSAAKNCRVFVHMIGEREVEGFGTVRYDVKYYPPWLENDLPTRTTINPGESSVFSLFRISPKGGTAVFFPSYNNYEEKAWIRFNIDDGSPPKSGPTFGTKYLINGNWEESYIEITGENCEKSTYGISFDGDLDESLFPKIDIFEKER